MEKTLIQIIEEALIGKSIKVIQYNTTNGKLITQLSVQHIRGGTGFIESYQEIIGIDIEEYDYEPASIDINFNGNTFVSIELSTVFTLKLI